MADGIKIRALTITTSVRAADVLVLDRLNTITNEDITYQISVKDFASGILINSDLNTLENLYDVVLNDLQVGDYLYYDGNYWINKQPETDGGGGGEFTGDALIFGPSTEPVNFKVIVGDKTEANRFDGVDDSTKAFYIDGTEAPVMLLAPGKKYRFDQSDSSNTGFTFAIYQGGPTHTDFTSSSPYNNPDLNDVTYVGTPGQAGAFTEIFITQKYEDGAFGNPVMMVETPQTLFYNCLAAEGEDFMGNVIKNVGRLEEPAFQDVDGGDGIFPLPLASEKITALEAKVEELQQHLSRLIEIE